MSRQNFRRFVDTTITQPLAQRSWAPSYQQLIIRGLFSSVSVKFRCESSWEQLQRHRKELAKREMKVIASYLIKHREGILSHARLDHLRGTCIHNSFRSNNIYGRPWRGIHDYETIGFWPQKAKILSTNSVWETVKKLMATGGDRPRVSWNSVGLRSPWVSQAVLLEYCWISDSMRRCSCGITIITYRWVWPKGGVGLLYLAMVSPLW